MNAYVTGKGNSRRVVLYDTLLEEFTAREIAMVMAHEVVHLLEPEKKLQYLAFPATVFAALPLGHVALEWGSRRRFLRFRSYRDIGGLPLLFLTFFMMFTLVRPLGLYAKRTHELETDRRSLNMLCDPGAFISAHVKLARLNKSEVDPGSLVEAFYLSHPPFVYRVRLACEIQCENRGLSEVGNEE